MGQTLALINAALEDRTTRAILSIGPLYGLTSAYYGNFYAAIPSIEDQRGISNGMLGNYLTIAVVGALISMPITPAVHTWFGSRTGDLIGFVGLSLCTFILSINSSDWLFGLGMILYGYTTIILYSSTIAQGAIMEKSSRNLWMGMFSAVSGVGGVLGGLIGGALIDYSGLSLWQEILFMNVILFAIFLVCFPNMFSHVEEREIMSEKAATAGSGVFEFLFCCNASNGIEKQIEEEERQPILSSTEPSSSSTAVSSENKDWLGMLCLCSIAGLSFFVEGSIGDWGSIYMQDTWDSGSLVGVLGYVTEKAMIICAGLICDWLCTKVFTRYLVFQLSVLLTSLGFGLSSLAYFLPRNDYSLAAAIVGFGIAGFGLGLQIPIWYSLAGQGLKGFNNADTGSLVITVANVMYFIEPTTMGNLSDVTGSLSYSFLVEAGLVLGMLILANVLDREYFSTKRKAAAEAA